MYDLFTSETIYIYTHTGAGFLFNSCGKYETSLIFYSLLHLQMTYRIRMCKILILQPCPV